MLAYCFDWTRFSLYTRQSGNSSRLRHCVFGKISPQKFRPSSCDNENDCPRILRAFAVRNGVDGRRRWLQVFRRIVHDHGRHDRHRGRVHIPSGERRLRRPAVQPVRRGGRQTGGGRQRGTKQIPGKCPLIMLSVKPLSADRFNVTHPHYAFALQISWLDDFKKARRGDYLVNFYDEAGYGQLRKLLRDGEPVGSVKPVHTAYVHYSGAYRGAWVNSEFLAAVVSFVVLYFAYTFKSKIVS